MQYHHGMVKAAKLLQKMRTSPKADWTPENIRSLCKAYDVKIRQRGTSHAVLTNTKGAHLTIPMHKPIKPVYIRLLIQLLEDVS